MLALNACMAATSGFTTLNTWMCRLLRVRSSCATCPSDIASTRAAGGLQNHRVFPQELLVADNQVGDESQREKSAPLPARHRSSSTVHTRAESAIPPLEETDIAAAHGGFDAQNFSLLLSRDEEMEVLRSLSSWNPGGGACDNSTYRNTSKGKGIQKRQRPSEVNTVLALAGGDSRIEIPTAPTKNPKSGMVTSTPDDAELLNDPEAWTSRRCSMRTLQSLFSVSEDDSILFGVTWMTWWIRVQTSVTETDPSETWPTRGTSMSRCRRFSTLTKLLTNLSRYYD